MSAGDSEHCRTLRDGWTIQSSAAEGSSGQDISAPAYDCRDWCPTSVPSTVLAALVRDGRFPDPFVGMNLRDIPTGPYEVPWWYRTQFVLSEREAQSTVLLAFDGINYAADIWLNGRLVAGSDTVRGAYRRFQFDVSRHVVSGDSCLAVEVAPPAPGDFSTGFVDWNPPAPDRNTGIFRPVRLRICHGVSIENPFVQSNLDTNTLAEASLTITADLVNHTDQIVTGILEGHIETRHFGTKVHLEPGQSEQVTFTADEFEQLTFKNPRVWWPHDLGTPELYDMQLMFRGDVGVSDVAAVRFGIREAGDYWTDEGHRGFKINGRKVLIRGAGWTDDLLLSDTAETIDAQLRYAKHMNLNCIRLEGIWGGDQTLYDLCDRYGILMMVGWSCHWEHEQYLGKPVHERYGGVVSPEDIELISRSWQDQLLWLRKHPSIFAWAVASDKVPAPELEKRYAKTFRLYDRTRPVLNSTGGVGSEQRIIGAEQVVSDITGCSGVKMLGPYAYTPPVYWYTDTCRGGAYGFNTETCPGAVVPILESVKKMIPAEHLWPINKCWEFHCGLNEFRALDRYVEAIRRRYGQAADVREFCRKAQVLNYELARPMFEAFRANKGRATGVIQWMLNVAWPKMYWQLYDKYLMPTGAFYGVRKACQPLQLIYHYGDKSVYILNDTPADVGDLTAEIRAFDVASREIVREIVSVRAEADCAKRILELGHLSGTGTCHFLDLRLFGSEGVEVSDNFYWLSAKPDVLDYDAKVEPWEYYTPTRHYADLTALNKLPAAKITAECEFEKNNDTGRISVQLHNASGRIAFFVELTVSDQGSGQSVVPVFWDDNYVSFLPGESRRLTVTFPALDERPAVTIRGWNVDKRTYQPQ